ncbi:hypothetical protein PZB74_15235 [Porifericola rhodea]|uniref:hypothetical protein n=1 Tax=Porifericola rhodea TaxID=930972 RepID=UPI00266578D1|nr:hypothetical protein [Porifericola rhodea]WKN30317.1 hypothetical protein PZB74_15235 [Porifericola rhodea]
MITSNILQRVFFVKYEKYKGTAFTYERDKTQYLVSVSHTFPYLNNEQEITYSIFQNNKWTELKGTIYKHPSPNADVVMISLSSYISPLHPIEYSVKGLSLSGDAYFLGFPYGKYMEDYNNLNNGYPLPFVKRALISTLDVKKEDIPVIYLDGMNNPGFSGGPCVFKKPNSNDLVVFGVIKGYMPNIVKVNSPFGEFEYTENSGIIEVHSINLLNGIKVK